jgi:hypothetical protein
MRCSTAPMPQLSHQPRAQKEFKFSSPLTSRGCRPVLRCCAEVLLGHRIGSLGDDREVWSVTLIRRSWGAVSYRRGLNGCGDRGAPQKTCITRETPHRSGAGFLFGSVGSCRPSASGSGRTVSQASAKFRVTAGSTGMPGPVVVDTTTFFR